MAGYSTDCPSVKATAQIVSGDTKRRGSSKPSAVVSVTGVRTSGIQKALQAHKSGGKVHMCGIMTTRSATWGCAMRHMQNLASSIRNSKKGILISISLVLAVGLVSSLLLSFNGGLSFEHTSSSTPAISCGRGIPAEKCNPQLAPPLKPLPKVNPKPVSPTPTGPQGKQCGMGFFTQQQQTEMTKQFGSISCLGLANQWIVVGDGMQTNPATIPPPPSPGGAIIAVLTCNANNASCLSSTATHDFTQFTVSYPPNPSVGRMDLQTTMNSHLINVTDGSCGSFTFDTTNLKWYTTTPGAVSELSAGTQLPSPVQTPPSVTGAVALATAAPSAYTASCSKQ